MDGKGLPRSTHHSPSYDTPPQPNANRRHRKPKTKTQNALCDNNGRSHGPPPPHHHDQNQSYPLFNNRSLTMISTMHHLNPHRKVAMSPEILREAEEQASTLKKAVKQLQEQLDQANREKARIHRFLSDLLYTLNARGYESVQDHEGTLIDLNKCKGETYLDLQGRDLKQRGNVRRQSGQEFLLKAVIGNQERAIQTLVYKLDSIGRDMVLGNRLCIDDNPGSPRSQDNVKVASLEAEVFQLVNLIEGACQNCPEVYPALRDHYYLQEEGAAAADRSPRNPVLQNLLKKCEQISAEARTKQLVDKLLTSVLNDDKLRPKSRQNGCSTSGSSSRSSSKATKTRSESKSKSSGHTKAPRAVSSDTSSVASEQSNSSEMYCPPLSPPPRSAEARGFGDHLKSLNGGSKSESSFKHKGHRVTRSQSQIANGCINGSVCHKSGGDPTMLMPGAYGGKYGADQSLHHECSVTICPYCHIKFGIEESIAEIKNHIEMHIYAGDRVV